MSKTSHMAYSDSASVHASDSQEKLLRSLFAEHEKRLLFALVQELDLRFDLCCGDDGGLRGAATIPGIPTAALKGERSPAPPRLAAKLSISPATSTPTVVHNANANANTANQTAQAPTVDAGLTKASPRQIYEKDLGSPIRGASPRGERPGTSETNSSHLSQIDRIKNYMGVGQQRMDWGSWGHHREITTISDREKAVQGGYSGEQENITRSRELNRRLSMVEHNEGIKGWIHSMRLTTTRLLSSKHFELCILVAIAANIAMVGWQADWSVQNPSQNDPVHFRAMDIAFSTLFTLEVSVRFMSEGFFLWSSLNPASHWNRFDFVLVIVAWLEEIFKASLNSTPGISAMRMIRIFRFVRVMRVVRVARFFHDLRIMVWGISHSMKSLVWALMLLLILSIMFGVMILEFVSHRLGEMGSEGLSTEDESLRENLVESWGSLSRTVYMLYQAICGGVDWGTVAAPLMDITPFLGFFFCLYIAMAIFCVLNIITGVFVENTKSMLNKDETTLIMETIESRKQWLEEVKSLWNSFSKNDLDLNTFKERIQDVRVQALFRRLGVEVEVEHIPGLFNLLDLKGTGFVTVDEFAMAIQMLHGHAKNIDMARLRVAVMSIMEQLKELTALCKDRDKDQAGDGLRYSLRGGNDSGMAPMFSGSRPAFGPPGSGMPRPPSSSLGGPMTINEDTGELPGRVRSFSASRAGSRMDLEEVV